MKKILSLLFIFNLFFITPILFVNNVNQNYLVYADDDSGPGEGGGDDNGNDLKGFDDQFVNMPDAGTGPSDEGFLATLAGFVASAVFTVTNAIATVTETLGLTTLTDIITSFGYSFGSNVASEEGLTAVGAGTLVSAVTGGVGGFVAGQAVTGAMQGTLGGDIAGIVGSITGGTDGPKSGTVNPPNGQTPPYIPNLPISKNLSVTDVANLSTTDYCPQSPVNYSITSNETFNKFKTQDYKPNWGDNDVFILKINVRSTDTTKGGQPIGFQFSDSLASRAFVRTVISKSKCDFGPDATWVGRPVGWQPSAQDIARYTYADGTKPTKFLGDNSASAEFTINDQRSGLLNLTTGTWYVTFQYLDNCSDKNTSNPNRNTTCHKVVSWQGSVQNLAPAEVGDILKSDTVVVANTISNPKTRTGNADYNDLGVTIPKSLSIEDIISPKILSTVRSWVGLPPISSDGTKSEVITTTDPVVNYCSGSYPDYTISPSGPYSVDIVPFVYSKSYSIKLEINDASTRGLDLAALPRIMTVEIKSGGLRSNKRITASKNPCDFGPSSQLVLQGGFDGWRYLTVNDTRSSNSVVNLSSGTWYINIKSDGECVVPGTEGSPNLDKCNQRVEFGSDFAQKYLGRSSSVGVTTGPRMVLGNGGTQSALGKAGADRILSQFSYWQKPEDKLGWDRICATSITKSELGSNGHFDYVRGQNVGLDVYPVNFKGGASYAGGSVRAVGLSNSTAAASAIFISDTPCPGTSTNVYGFGGSISGSQGTITTTDYTGNIYTEVKVSPGKWYISALYGPNYVSAAGGIKPEPPYVRFENMLSLDTQSQPTSNSPSTGTGTGTGVNFTPRTISNSACTINLSGAQYGTVNTTLVYREFPPNAPGGYYTGGTTVIPTESLIANLAQCPSNVSDGLSSGMPGNRGTFRNIEPVCKDYDDKTRATTVYRLDYPTACTTLCSSANSSAVIDVRGDCVVNGTGSF